MDLTRRLGAIANELDLAEIEVESGEVRVRVHRAGTSHAAVAASAAPPTAVTAAAPAATDSARGGDDVKGVTIDAPMVGTFYRASSPTAEPYVREGDMVKEGQIVCIIEAMKLMNEIESRTAGRIVKILVDNAQAVEYGQPLFIIEPSR